MTTPGTVSSTSPARVIGRASSWRAVIAPWLADCAIPRRFCAGFSASARFVKVDSAGYRDVGAQGEMEDDIRARACNGQVDIPTGGREIEQRELDAITPRRDIKSNL